MSSLTPTSTEHVIDATRSHRLFLSWLAFSMLCVLAMWLAPSYEVVPYHAIWIGFALLYGFEPWSMRVTAVGLASVCVVSGALLAYHLGGEEAWRELFEIPLMLLLCGLVVWHVQRRESALRTVNSLARERIATAAARERLGRLTSHEIRTPLTVAGCYVELLRRDEADPARLRDFSMLQDELARIERATDRLLRMVQLHDHLPTTRIRVRAALEQTVDRWSAVARRTWVVESTDCTLEASPERLVACLDTLVENAVRYTGEEDTVRLFASEEGAEVVIGVADSGPGFTPELIASLNDEGPNPAAAPAGRSSDPLSQTGLGLGLVQEILKARGGRLRAGRSDEGGALLVLRLPRRRTVS
ncbi:HAMP domain-containing sensor histidine kinase [Nocardioides sp.]|uniref:sensor histidine kinase n=1 Tax=Nocardioides sp. TaxID=35761 RepID=UPI0025E4626A|nr:HAMP domain-containing sensor histidine kinase [Nocardioides sp.]